MRRAPSCLLFAGFVLSLGLVNPEGVLAQPGIRHSPSALQAGWTKRPHVTRREHRIRPRHWRADRRLHKGGHRHGFLPYRSWSYVDTAADQTPLILEREPAPPRALPGSPSIADLPVSAGIRSAPAASPTIYVLSGDRRSLRRGSGAKVLTMDADAETESRAGPRIIHLNVPRR